MTNDETRISLDLEMNRLGFRDEALWRSGYAIDMFFVESLSKRGKEDDVTHPFCGVVLRN